MTALNPKAPAFVPPSEPSSSKPWTHPSSPDQHKPLICQFHNTSSGCKNSSSCRYVHERPGDLGIHNAKPGAWEQRIAKERTKVKAKLMAKGKAPDLTRDWMARPSASVKYRAKEEAIKVAEKEKVKVKEKLAKENIKDLIESMRNLGTGRIECRYWAAGYCARGSKCNNIHTRPAPPSDDGEDPYRPACSICFEDALESYGLMSECAHAFCMECVKTWRARREKRHWGDDPSIGGSKTCPLCRKTSHYVIPSSLFHGEGARKREVDENYLAVTKKNPCKYIQVSGISFNRRVFCPYGDECRYSHYFDGREITFGYGVNDMIKHLRSEFRRYRLPPVGQIGQVPRRRPQNAAIPPARQIRANQRALNLHRHILNALQNGVRDIRNDGLLVAMRDQLDDIIAEATLHQRLGNVEVPDLWGPQGGADERDPLDVMDEAIEDGVMADENGVWINRRQPDARHVLDVGGEAHALDDDYLDFFIGGDDHDELGGWDHPTNGALDDEEQYGWQGWW